MCIDDLSRQPQAEAEPAELPVGNRADEALEDALAIEGRNAQPAVFDHDECPPRIRIIPHLDGLPLPIAKRVGQEA